MNRVYELFFLSATECDAYCWADCYFSVSRNAQMDTNPEMSEQFHTGPWCKCGNKIFICIQFFKDVSFGINSAAFKDLFCGKSESKAEEAYGFQILA